MPHKPDQLWEQAMLWERAMPAIISAARRPPTTEPAKSAAWRPPTTEPAKSAAWRPPTAGHLSSFLQGQISLLGFGNRMWGDDGAGSWLAQALEENTVVHAVDGGMVPENHLEKIVLHNPEAILLVDAADFGGEAGEWRLLEPDDVLLSGVSTHAGSPQMLAKYLEARTGARVGMLVIQPGDVSEGEGLSAEVSATVNQLLELFATDC